MAANMKGWHFIPAHRERGTVQEVNGSHGRVLQYDDDTLSVYVIGSHKARAARNLDGAKEFTEGEGEITVHVPNSTLDAACKLIGARKKRVSTMTPEQRQAAAERLKPHQFKATATKG